jgi:hypothetical protein
LPKSRALSEPHLFTEVVLFRFVLLIVCLAFLGCEPQVAPPLVEVTDLTPREIEPGDRLEIHGTGFPQGRTGRVKLAGTVFRPGEAPTRGVSVEAEGVVAAPDRLEVIVRDPIVERLCGAGERAAHATFRADVEISFASNAAGAKPLVGRLRGATLDILPASASATAVDDRLKDGAKVLAFLGIVSGAPSGRGLPVEQVTAGSPAARAGIQVGDLVSSVDGVHALSVGDVTPASARSTELAIRHGDSGEEETKTLSLVEFSGERIPIEYAPALLVVGLALAILVVLLLPGPPFLAAMEMRIASRLRRTSLRSVFAALLGGRHAGLTALLSALLAGFAMMPYVFGREIDGIILLLAGATLLVAARVARERGVIASIRTVLQAGLAVIALAGSLALAIAQVGAIELAELVRLQGGAPWQLTAARHPSCAIAAFVYSCAIVALLRHDAARPLQTRAGVFITAALGVMVFFGGWQVPGLLDARHTSGILLLAATAFLLKTWLFAGLLIGASRVASKLGVVEVQGMVVKRLVPALLLATACVFASRRFAPSIAIETAFGGTFFAVAFLFALRVATRVRAALAQPEPHASTVL